MNWIDYRLAVKVWFGLVKGDFRMFNSFKVSIADMLHDVHHSGRGSHFQMTYRLSLDMLAASLLSWFTQQWNNVLDYSHLLRLASCCFSLHAFCPVSVGIASASFVLWFSSS